MRHNTSTIQQDTDVTVWRGRILYVVGYSVYISLREEQRTEGGDLRFQVGMFLKMYKNDRNFFYKVTL